MSRTISPITPRLLMHSEPLLIQDVQLLKTEILDENEIKNINRLIFNNAYRFVFSNKKDFLV